MTLVLSAMSGAAMSYAYEIQDHIIQYGVNISMAVWLHEILRQNIILS